MMNTTESSLSESELVAFRKAFSIPNSVQTRIPTMFQVAEYPPAGMIAVYADFFVHCGLCFPLTQFFKDILAAYRIHLTQLCPDAVRTITRFEKISVALSLEPKVSSFRYFYRLKPSIEGWFTLSTRDGISNVIFPELTGWENRFFFMDVHPFFPGNMNWHSLRVHDPVRKFGEYDDSAVLRLCHVLARFKAPYLEAESFPCFEQGDSLKGKIEFSETPMKRKGTGFEQEVSKHPKLSELRDKNDKWRWFSRFQ